MKRVVGTAKLITISLSVVICVVLCNKITTYVFSVDGYSCVFDSKISNYHKNEIFDFINASNNFKTSGLQYIAQNILDQFHVIKSVELAQVASGILYVTLQSFEPKFIINDTCVIAQNGAFFDTKLFSKKSIEHCCCLSIKDFDLVGTATGSNKKYITETCKNMIFSLPKECFNQYGVVLESETKNYMTDKLQKKFGIIFSDKHFPSENILAACAYLKDTLQERGEFLNKRNTRWFADVRFKDQIVLCKERRGR